MLTGALDEVPVAFHLRGFEWEPNGGGGTSGLKPCFDIFEPAHITGRKDDRASLAHPLSDLPANIAGGTQQQHRASSMGWRFRANIAASYSTEDGAE